MSHCVLQRPSILLAIPQNSDYCRREQKRANGESSHRNSVVLLGNGVKYAFKNVICLCYDRSFMGIHYLYRSCLRW